MSLDQYTGAERTTIDLTTDPPTRYADRFALPGMPARQASPPPTIVTRTVTPVPPARARAPRINVMTVLAVSIVAAFAMLLVGLVTSAQY